MEWNWANRRSRKQFSQTRIFFQENGSCFPTGSEGILVGGSPGLTPQLVHAPLGVARSEQALGPAGQLLDVPPVLLHRALLPQVPLQHHDGALFVLGGGAAWQYEHSERRPRDSPALQVPQVGESQAHRTPTGNCALLSCYSFSSNAHTPPSSRLPQSDLYPSRPSSTFCSVITSSITPAFRDPHHLTSHPSHSCSPAQNPWYPKGEGPLGWSKSKLADGAPGCSMCSVEAGILRRRAAHTASPCLHSSHT